MANPTYIYDVAADKFSSLVVEESKRTPVLAFYWSPRTGASMLLMPRLIRLTTQCGGRFVLALINTDDLGARASEHAVEQVPTLKLYLDGAAVDTLQGDDSEAGLRAFIKQHLPLRGASRLYAEAVRAYSAGDGERAAKLAHEAVLMEPDNLQTPIDLLKILVLAGRFPEADQLLRVLPPAVRDHAEVNNLMTHLSFIRISQCAPPLGALETAVASDPANLEARYQLAATKVVQNDFDGAMQQLLEIARRNPTFRDHAGRNGLLALFHMLGDGDQRVQRYRGLLQDSMN
jgi:putative thioredoxin